MNQANGNGADKATRFKNLAERRVSRALYNIRGIARLSRRTSYEFTPAQIEKIFETLREELVAAEEKFAPQAKQPRQQTIFTL